MVKEGYIEMIKDRLQWCIDTERYEMAARLRDQIRLHSTREGEDEEWKQQYYLSLAKKYAPEFCELFNKTNKNG
jgi:hypothetical protein